MNRLCKILSVISFLIAILFFAIGSLTGMDQVVEARSSVGLSVVEPERSFGDLLVGHSTILNFAVTNPTGRPIRIVGASGRCSGIGCIAAPLDSLPLVVSAGGRCNIKVSVYGKSAGVFAMRLPFHSDDPQVPRIEVSVQGRIVDHSTPE